MADRTPHQERKTTWQVLLWFLVSLVGSVGFVYAYQIAAGAQLEAITLAVAFIGLGFGLAVWSRGLMPPGPFVEERADAGSTEVEEEEAADAFAAGSQGVGRRRLLGGALGISALGLGVAAVTPARSLGPAPGGDLYVTPWPGKRVVDEEERPVSVEALQYGAAITVFPEGFVGKADSQVILIRLTPGSFFPAPGREDWTPEGYVAYSKVCTHAGCPVGLFQNQSNVLLCPCHQATFDALDAARPVFGPSPRPLPQLPLGIDPEGILYARGDFSDPVGPAFWEIGS